MRGKSEAKKAFEDYLADKQAHATRQAVRPSVSAGLETLSWFTPLMQQKLKQINGVTSVEKMESRSGAYVEVTMNDRSTGALYTKSDFDKFVRDPNGFDN